MYDFVSGQFDCWWFFGDVVYFMECMVQFMVCFVFDEVVMMFVIGYEVGYCVICFEQWWSQFFQGFGKSYDFFKGVKGLIREVFSEWW